MTIQERVSELVALHLDQEPLQNDKDISFDGLSLQRVQTSDGDSPGCVRFVVEDDGEPTNTEVLILITTFGKE